MEAQKATFNAYDTQLLAVAVQDLAGAQASVNSTGVSYPILTDPHHTIAESYQVYNTLGDSVATPAVFIINKAGHIVWAYIGDSINDRPSVNTIIENLPSS